MFDGPRGQQAGPYQRDRQRLGLLSQSDQAVPGGPDGLLRMHIQLVLVGDNLIKRMF